MKKKIFCVFVAVFVLCVSLSSSVFAAVTENSYFFGDPVTLDSSTLDGSYVGISKGFYVENSFEMPFLSNFHDKTAETKKYNYGSITDLIIDYSEYQAGTLRFSIEFYNGEELYRTFDIDIILDNNNTAQVADDTYKIALFSGNDNLDGEYKDITPNSTPYIAFNLGAVFVKGYEAHAAPTHFKISYTLANCTAAFNIYGVMETSLTYGEIWQEGYNKGTSDGVKNGYNDGYKKGYDKGVDVGKDSVDTETYYNDGYNSGYQAGVEENEAYNVGFEAGKKWRGNNTASVNAFSEFFKTVMGSITSFFLYLGTNIEFLGTPILGILGVFIIGILAVVLFKLVKK